MRQWLSWHQRPRPVVVQRYCGNSGLWYVIADANSLSDPNAPLVGGTQLKTPSVSVNSNDAQTFKPYDPSAAIGPTSPSLPYITPPPKHHCNAVAMILMVVIAVVVTVFTAGLTAPGAFAAFTSGTMGIGTTMAVGVATLEGAAGLGVAVAAGAIGGFAGSVASQAVGSAMGVAHFSWKNALASGIAGGITAGVASWASGSSVVKNFLGMAGDFRYAAASAVVDNLANYGANKLLGNPASFSWKSIAASAISAAITSQVVPKLGEALHINLGTTTGQMQSDLLAGITGGIVSASVRGALGIKHDDIGTIFADAFGNALGDMLSGQDAGNAASVAQQQDAQAAAKAYAMWHVFDQPQSASGLFQFGFPVPSAGGGSWGAWDQQQTSSADGSAVSATASKGLIAGEGFDAIYAGSPTSLGLSGPMHAQVSAGTGYNVSGTLDVTSPAFAADPLAGSSYQMKYNGSWMGYANDPRVFQPAKDQSSILEAQQKYNAAEDDSNANHMQYDPAKVLATNLAINEMIAANGWTYSPAPVPDQTVEVIGPRLPMASNTSGSSGAGIAYDTSGVPIISGNVQHPDSGNNEPLKAAGEAIGTASFSVDFLEHTVEAWAKIPALKVLSRASALWRDKMADIGAKNIGKSISVFGPNAKTTTELTQAAKTYGRALKGIAAVGYVLQAAQAVTYFANAPKGYQASAASAAVGNFAGGTAAILAGAEVGAGLGAMFGPLDWITIPVGTVIFASLAAYGYEKTIQRQVEKVGYGK